MSIQMTVRLSDEAGQHVDREVAAGHFPSRAAYLDWLARKAARAQRALDDLQKLTDQGALPDAYPDLDGLVDWVAENPINMD